MGAKGSGKSALGMVQKYHPGVLKVVDAKKDAEISVTAEDCKRSRKKSPDSCAMAKACLRSYDGAIISLSTAYLIKGDKAYRYQVPTSVSREIVSFDRHHDFAPGDYRLKAPSKTFKLGPRKYRLDPKRHLTAYKQHKTRNHRTAGIRSL